MTIVFLVMTNGTILAAYAHRRHAELHERTLTGCRILELPVLNGPAASVLDDIDVEVYDENSDTDVTMPIVKGDG